MEKREEIHIDVLKFQRGYCNWILSHKVQCAEYIAYYQEYGRDRHPRYDYAIDWRGNNGEIFTDYDPLRMANN